MTSVESSLPSTSFAAAGDEMKAPLTCELYNIRGTSFPLDYVHISATINNDTTSTNTKERKVTNDTAVHVYLNPTQRGKLKAKLEEPTTGTCHPMDFHMNTYDGTEFGHLWHGNKTNYFGDVSLRDAPFDFGKLRWPADKNYKQGDHVMLFLQTCPRHFSEQSSSEMQEFHMLPFQKWLLANASNLKSSFILVIHPTVLPVYVRGAIDAYKSQMGVMSGIEFFKQLFYQVHVVQDPYAHFAEFYCGFQEPSQPDHLVCTLEGTFSTNHFLNFITKNAPSVAPGLREKVNEPAVPEFESTYKGIKFEVDTTECEVHCSVFVPKDTSGITSRLLGNAVPFMGTHPITNTISFEDHDTDPLLETLYFHNAMHSTLMISPQMPWGHKFQYYFDRKDYDKLMALFATDALLGKVYADYKTKTCPLKSIVESYSEGKLKDMKARTIVSYVIGVVDQIYQLVDKMVDIDNMIAKEPLNRFRVEYNQAKKSGGKSVPVDDDDDTPPRAAKMHASMSCGAEGPRAPPPPPRTLPLLSPTPSC